jgi:uncharacterized membrane protein
VSYDFKDFNVSIALQPNDYINGIDTQSRIIFIEQKLNNGKHERHSLELDFSDQNKPKRITNSAKTPKFIDGIDPYLYINGILINYDSVFVLVNFNGLNKFCKTIENFPKVS